MNRVPRIVFSYCIIKIASTTLGETGADMFSMTLGLGYGVTILAFLALFGILLGVKLALRRHAPLQHWGVFTASAILGTAVSDYIDRTLELGYAAGSALLTLSLPGTLAIWYVGERSLSVERIETTGAEIFYGLAFLIANTLGTAAGDHLSDELGIGFLQSAALIAGLPGLTALAHHFTSLSGVFLFRVAFVLTRPFGATFGDMRTKPLENGGLDLGTVGASAFFAVLMAVALWRERRVEPVAVPIDGQDGGARGTPDLGIGREVSGRPLPEVVDAARDVLGPARDELRCSVAAGPCRASLHRPSGRAIDRAPDASQATSTLRNRPSAPAI